MLNEHFLIMFTIDLLKFNVFLLPQQVINEIYSAISWNDKLSNDKKNDHLRRIAKANMGKHDTFILYKNLD